MSNARHVPPLVRMMALAVLVCAAAPPSAAPQTVSQGREALQRIPVPVVRVKGSHYDVGRQLGTRLKANLVREVSDLKALKDWERIRAEASLFLAYSRKYVPEYVAEVQGAADAAGLTVDDLFPTVCEEIGGYGYPFTRGCSDLIASGDVTEDGSVLAAHNNDTGVSTQERVTIVHYAVDGEPEIVAVGYGALGISVGYNSAGISLTGNQVDANDMRVGVPRFLLVRKILAARTIGEAIDAAILKERASDYNQVIADASGEIYSIEGSATDYAPLYATDGYLVHTNHFVAPWMRKFELDPQAITDSIVRYNRANRLMRNAAPRITVEKLKAFLADHVNRPGSICRHGDRVKTTFSVIIDLGTLKMLLARGNPCEVAYEEYDLLARR